MADVALHLFGSPSIERDGTPVHLDTRKAIALLAYLALTGRRHNRDALAALLWPEGDHDHARAALRRTLSALNQALEGQGLVIEREAIGLEAGGGFWIDLREFTDRLSACQSHGHPASTVCLACLPLLSEA